MFNSHRRSFITAISTTAVAVPFSALVASLPSQAADMPQVDPTSPAAKALQFVVVSVKPDQQCGTCTYFQGDKGAENGPCQLFPENSVAGTSWCSGYTPIG